MSRTACGCKDTKKSKQNDMLALEIVVRCEQPCSSSWCDGGVTVWQRWRWCEARVKCHHHNLTKGIFSTPSTRAIHHGGGCGGHDVSILTLHDIILYTIQTTIFKLVEWRKQRLFGNKLVKISTIGTNHGAQHCLENSVHWTLCEWHFEKTLLMKLLYSVFLDTLKKPTRIKYGF
jgi:hypothetical protein